MSINLSDFDVTPEDIINLNRNLGRALWSCSLLEYIIANHIVIVFKSPYDSIESAEAALEGAFLLTLGNLLKEFRKAVSVEEDLDGRFQRFKEERDWLCHRVYRQSHTALYNKRRLLELFDRLENFISEIKDLVHILEKDFDLWCLRNGISEEEVALKIRKSVNEWKKP